MDKIDLTECGISLLFNDDGLRIEIRDNVSATTFFKAYLTPKQTCQAMSRLAHTPCETAEVRNIDRLGKKLIVDTFAFELPGKISWENQKEVAKEIALKTCPHGWVPNLAFSSQGSFLKRGGKNFARTTISRWE